MLKNWIKIAYQNFKRSWLFNVINIFGLTIGLIGFILVTLYWNDEVSYNQWVPEKDNIYLLEKGRQGNYWGSTSYMEANTSSEVISEIEDNLMVASGYYTKLVRVGETSIFNKRIAFADTNFFDFFPFEIIEGQSKNCLPDLNSVVLSEKLAKQLFKNGKAVGKKVRLDKDDCLVTAVYKTSYPSGILPEAIMKLHIKAKDKERWYGQYDVYYKLSPEANYENVITRLEDISIEHTAKKHAKEEGISLEAFFEKYGKTNYYLTPLTETRLKAKSAGQQEGKGSLVIIRILFALSLIILCLSCFNFINLTISGAVKRAKEVGLRKALGSKRNAITLQYLFETAVLCFISLLLALILIEVVLPYFNDFFEKNLKLESVKLYLQLIFVLIVLTLLSGALPSLYLSNFQPLKVLKGNFSRNKSGIWVRNGLLLFQFIISGVFIIGILTVNEQIQYMLNKDLGFKGDQTFIVPFKDWTFLGDSTALNHYQKYKLAKTELSKLSDVKGVTASTTHPGGGFNYGAGVKYNEKTFRVSKYSIEFNYPEVMDLKLKKGRWLSPKFSSDTITNCVVNESFVRELNLDKPLETKFGVWENKTMSIVGVVKDFHFKSLEEVILPIMMVHINEAGQYKENMVDDMQIKISSENIEKTIADVEAFYSKHLEPGYPFEYEFLDKKFATTYKNHLKQRTLFFLLSIIVLIISLLGLFALAAYNIEQRLREIAIRKTLGASANHLIYKLSVQYLKIAVTGVIIAFPVVYFLLQKWLENYYYRIDMPVLPYVFGFLALILLTLSITGILAKSATRVDLVKHLKYE